MAAVDISTLCAEIPGDECFPLTIIFPGDVEVQVTVPGMDIMNAYDVTKQLMGMLNTALAPFAPLFNAIDVVIGIFNIIKAIPDAFGPPPDPKKLIDAIAQVEGSVDKLASLVPPLSIPVFIKSVLQVLICFLEGMVSQLEAIVSAEELIENALQRAAAIAEYPGTQLNVAIGCANGAIAAQLAGMGQGLTPFNHLLEVIDLFLGLAGMKPLGASAAIGDDAGAAIAPLQALITVLSDVRAAIVV